MEEGRREREGERVLLYKTFHRGKGVLEAQIISDLVQLKWV